MQLKKLFIVIIFSFVSINIFSQEIKAEKELLTLIPLGTNNNQVYYYSTEEIWEKPGNPHITDKGEIVFGYYSVDRSDYDSDGHKLRTSSCSFYKKIFTVSKEKRFVDISCGLIGQNINGLYFDYSSGDVKYCKNDLIYPIALSGFKQPDSMNNIEYIPVEKGLIVDSSDYYDTPSIIGIEIENGKQVRTVYRYEINDWLKTQKGNYEVRDDGKLYKNGLIYSLTTVRGVRRIVARLPSGHCVYPVSKSNINYIPKFIIKRPNGETELEVEIPWSVNEETYDGCYYDFSFGNYGEMYALVTPEIKDADEPYNHTFTKGNAELVCVRNYLKYFGVLTDDRIRLRSEPTTSSESLGTYPINTGFRILEKGTKQETIGGDTGVWYKVRLLDGKEGWFFGAYVRDLYDGPGTPLPWPNVADWN